MVGAEAVVVDGADPGPPVARLGRDQPQFLDHGLGIARAYREPRHLVAEGCRSVRLLAEYDAALRPYAVLAHRQRRRPSAQS